MCVCVHIDLCSAPHMWVTPMYTHGMNAHTDTHRQIGLHTATDTQVHKRSQTHIHTGSHMYGHRLTHDHRSHTHVHVHTRLMHTHYTHAHTCTPPLMSYTAPCASCPRRAGPPNPSSILPASLSPVPPNPPHLLISALDRDSWWQPWPRGDGWVGGRGQWGGGAWPVSQNPALPFRGGGG